MRPALRLILAFACLCVMALGRANAAPILSISAPATASFGDTVTVNIAIAGVVDLYSFQFDLSFDPAILAASSSAEGPFLPGGGATFFVPGSIDNMAGIVSATADTLLTAVPGVSGNGTLASVSFSAIGIGPSDLTLSNVTLLDSNLNAIAVSLNNGSITVLSGPTSGIPEPATAVFLAAGMVIVIGRLIFPEIARRTRLSADSVRRPAI